MKGQIWWFSKPGTIDPVAVIHALDQRGLTYRHPGSTSELMVHLYDDGTRREGTIDEVVHRFESELASSMVWLDRDTNVLFGPGEALHQWSFELDGLNWAEGQRVVFAVIGCALGTPGTLGVVADHQLPDRYEDWVHYFEHRGQIPYAADLLLRTSTGRHYDHTLHLPDWSWLGRKPQ